MSRARGKAPKPRQYDSDEEEDDYAPAPTYHINTGNNTNESGEQKNGNAHVGNRIHYGHDNRKIGSDVEKGNAKDAQKLEPAKESKQQQPEKEELKAPKPRQYDSDEEDDDYAPTPTYYINTGKNKNRSGKQDNGNVYADNREIGSNVEKGNAKDAQKQEPAKESKQQQPEKEEPKFQPFSGKNIHFLRG